MPNNDVQIRIIGKDDATGAFKGVAREAKSTQQQMDTLGQSVGSLHSVLGNTAAYGAAIMGLGGITDALHEAASSAIEFYNTMQTGAISLAGSLMSMGEIGGKTIEWNEALGMSRTLMRELSDQALVTGASTKEISEVFRAMLPNALNAKMTIEQTLKLASALTTTGKAMGIDGNILSRDVRDLITGNNVQRTVLGMQLGITNDDIKQAKQSADGLYNFLQERLRGEMEANQHYLETFEGRLNHLKESISRIGGEALTPIITDATEEMSKLANSLVAIDDHGNVLGLNGDAIESIRNAAIVAEHFGAGMVQVGQDIATIASPALSAFASLIELAAEHTTTLTELTLALWVSGKIGYYITDYRNALTGAAEAQTFLGRAIAETRVQMEAQTAAQRSANMAVANSAMTSLAQTSTSGARSLMSAENVAKEISLNAALNTSIQANIDAEVARMTAAQRTRTAFEGALAAMRAGETELATRILETTATMDAQGTTAGMMAARATEAINLVRMGQVELAEQVMATTIAFELQGTQAVATSGQQVAAAATAKEAQAALAATTATTSAASTAAGVAAEVASARTVSAIAVAGNAVRSLTNLSFNLIGGWVGVAAAIGYALYKLYQYASAENEWAKDHTYWYNGSTWVVDRNGNATRQDANVPTGLDYTGVATDYIGVGAGWGKENPDDVAAVKKMNAEHEQELKRQQEEREKNEMIASMEKAKRMQEAIAKERPDLIGKVTGKYPPGDDDAAKKANKEAAAAQRKAAKAAREQAKANKEYANTIAENSQRIAQVNEKISNIIDSLNDKILGLTGTQYQVDMARIAREVSGISKQIASGVTTLKTFSPTAGTSSGSYSTAQNWQESLLSGDDAITTLTAQKLHLLAEKYYELTGTQPTVTSMHRYGDGSSYHDSGQAFDLSDDNLANNADLRHQLADYAATIGLNALDEYETQYGPNGQYYGSNNVHFTDHGTPLPAGTASAPVTPTISQASAAIPQTEKIRTIAQVVSEMNSPYYKLLLAIATYESGDQKNVSTIGSNTYNPASGAAGLFQILSGQDYLGADGQRHAIPSDYAATDRQNTIAAIDLLSGKIREHGGDIWAGVKAYGDGTDSYVEGVRSIYESIGGSGTDLAPTGTSVYKSPFMDTAYQRLSDYQKEAVAKVIKDWQDRRNQYSDDAATTAADIGLGYGDTRLSALQLNVQKTLRELEEKRDDVYKAVVGSGTDDKEGEAIVTRYETAMREKALREEAAKERELRQTQHDEYMTHLESMAGLQDDYTAHLEQNQAEELRTFTAYQQEQLKTAQLTLAQRTKLEEELYSNLQKLHSLEAKGDWGQGLQQLGRNMRTYTQDIGTALTNGWNSITQQAEGAFDDMLTSSESFGQRMTNLVTGVANIVLNTMMKIIMQGLIANTVMSLLGMGGSATSVSSALTSSVLPSFTGGATLDTGSYLPTSYSYSHGITGFASGGQVVAPGYIMAGEGGRELIQMSGSGYVYNAKDTADILRAAASPAQSGAGLQNVEVRVVNESGQQVKATQTTAQVDGKKLIVTTVLEAIATDYMGARSLIKGAVGGV